MISNHQGNLINNLNLISLLEFEDTQTLGKMNEKSKRRKKNYDTEISSKYQKQNDEVSQGQFDSDDDFSDIQGTDKSEGYEMHLNGNFVCLKFFSFCT